MTPIVKTIKFGEHTLTLETGRMAKQSHSVLADLDGTSVLVAVVGNPEPVEGRDFFPLRVDYQEKAYAAGKIPGGFFKREGRPSERETLIARLIDRPIRPLFPKGFYHDVQVTAVVVSLNPEVEADVVAMIGASAALAISGMPFNGPMGAARVGYNNGEFILNPTIKQLAKSELDLVVAGTESSVLMVESEASELAEDVMLQAVMFGHKNFQPVINMIQELAKELANESWDWQPSTVDQTLSTNISNAFKGRITEAYTVADKMERKASLDLLRKEAAEQFVNDEEGSDSEVSSEHVAAIVENIESDVVRGRILQGEPRIDGRDTKTIRKITTEIGVLNRTHGSALFTRGETQALVSTTLGTAGDAQLIDDPFGERKDPFMLHYNFPPFSVGEVGMLGSPKRREIGHGNLAKRAIKAVLPNMDKFPYVVRIVSEILESNGSSSMATVCGTSLALMDAGVPVSSPVAGIAMGLIKEGDNYAVLSDILGDEDHLGDMDFKVAGTDKGVTALQMDIKISGITEDIMQVALDQAKTGRMHILGIMNETINAAKEDVSEFAPHIVTFSINPEKIKDVIGKGGSTIKGLIEDTGANIDIQDDGTVQIAADDKETAVNLQEKIAKLTEEAEIGNIYVGKVVRILDFGAFVNILPGKDGLLHISQIADYRVQDVRDELSEGQQVRVKLLDIDKQGRLKLSMKGIEQQD